MEHFIFFVGDSIITFMIKRSNLIFVLGMIVVSSCNHIYREYDKESFPSYTWQKNQEIVFNPTIEDVTKSYTLTIGIRHLYGLKQNAIDVVVKSVSPSGKEIIKEYKLKVMDAEGKYLAKCGGDLCDLETVIEQNLKFQESGQYHITITPAMKDITIPGVMEVGIIVDEVK